MTKTSRGASTLCLGYSDGMWSIFYTDLKITFVFFYRSSSTETLGVYVTNRHLSCFQHSIQSNRKSWQNTLFLVHWSVMNLWCCKFGCLEPRPRTWSVIQFLMYGCSSVPAAVALKPVLIQWEHYSTPSLTLLNLLLGPLKGDKVCVVEHTLTLSCVGHFSSRTRALRGLLQLTCSSIGSC